MHRLVAQPIRSSRVGAHRLWDLWGGEGRRSLPGWAAVGVSLQRRSEPVRGEVLAVDEEALNRSEEAT